MTNEICREDFYKVPALNYTMKEAMIDSFRRAHFP